MAVTEISGSANREMLKQGKRNLPHIMRPEIIDSLEKNSLDLYSSFKSIYLQDRSNKIKNSPDNQDDWGNLEN